MMSVSDRLLKWYTRAIGVYFTAIVVPLAGDYAVHGFRPETMHKLFHIALGLIVLSWGWNNPAWWRPFTIANACFFGFVAATGWFFPDFGAPDLEAFGREDTVLHSVVALLGVVAITASRR